MGPLYREGHPSVLHPQRLHCSNVRIEQTYKGNYHLLADIDGKERKFVIGRNNPEHAIIQAIGTANLTEEQLKEMCGKYFSPHR